MGSDAAAREEAAGSEAAGRSPPHLAVAGNNPHLAAGCSRNCGWLVSRGREGLGARDRDFLFRVAGEADRAGGGDEVTVDADDEFPPQSRESCELLRGAELDERVGSALR